MHKFSHLSIPRQQFTGKKIISRVSTPDQLIFSSNFSLFSFTSDIGEGQFTKTLQIGSFLVYRLTKDSQSSILNSFCTQKGFETTRNDSESEKIEVLYEKGELTVDLTGLQVSQSLSGFEMTSQNISFRIENQVLLCSKAEIFNNFNLQRFYTDLESTLSLFHHQEKFLLKALKIELDRQRVLWTKGPRGGYLYEEFPEKGQKVEVEVWVQRNSIIFEVSLEKNNKKIENSVQTYLNQINETSISGKFRLGEKFFFTSSFTAFETTQENMNIFQTIKTHMKVFVFHYRKISEIEKIHQMHEKITQLGLTQVKKSLSSEDFQKEKTIKKLMDQSKDSFFNNRFLNNRITFLADFSVIYYKNLNFSTFQEFSEEHPGEVLKSIFQLIERLSEVNLNFKNNHFPLSEFAWYEEKPVFLYNHPLSSFLQPFEKPTRKVNLEKNDSILKTKENFFKSLIFLQNDFQSPDISQEECEFFFESSEFIPINEDFSEKKAKTRLALFQSNNFPFVRKNQAFAFVGHQKFLVCSPGFEVGLEEKLFQDFEEKNEIFTFLKNFLKQVLEIVEFFMVKGAGVTCFDPDGLGFGFDGKMMVELWATEEVRSQFVPPEVAFGRSHRFSIVFCLGKVILHIFEVAFQVMHQEDEESSEEEMSFKVFREFRGLEELVVGCTQKIVMKRWSLCKVKEKIFEICENFPII
jgi:hypothetical protein